MHCRGTCDVSLAAIWNVLTEKRCWMQSHIAMCNVLTLSDSALQKLATRCLTLPSTAKPENEDHTQAQRSFSTQSNIGCVQFVQVSSCRSAIANAECSSTQDPGWGRERIYLILPSQSQLHPSVKPFRLMEFLVLPLLYFTPQRYAAHLGPCTQRQPGQQPVVHPNL